MAIIHNEPCGGTILFETREAALERLTHRGQPVPAAPKEFRQFYCPLCGKTWPNKREVWKDAHGDTAE